MKNCHFLLQYVTMQYSLLSILNKNSQDRLTFYFCNFVLLINLKVYILRPYFIDNTTMGFSHFGKHLNKLY